MRISGRSHPSSDCDGGFARIVDRDRELHRCIVRWATEACLRHVVDLCKLAYRACRSWATNRILCRHACQATAIHAEAPGVSHRSAPH